jgi:hypothetical protein
MLRLFLETIALAIVVSPVVALVGLVFDLSHGQTRLIGIGVGVYLFLAYYEPRVRRLVDEKRRGGSRDA